MLNLTLRRIACATICCLAVWGLSAQTAHDRVPAYTGDFGQGMNFGWYDTWLDEDLGRISAGTPDGSVPGIGVNSIRPGLFAWFLEQFGYDIRVNTFDTYASLGLRDNVVIMGFPSPDQQSEERWCATGGQSHLFKGMWEPIWDDNFGTPYNENNTYAEYMYKAVELYGDGVTFWEIWNEPDINYSGNGWKDRSYPDNWFDNDPDPCELVMQAPVQAYVRMLRISYEVVKRLQPNDYVAIGGIGYASFLDAVLRMTDEKSSGAVTAEHPLTGGAYFDALSYHVYPHVDGAFREWNNDAGRWDYTRNSDVAVGGVEDKWRSMEQVLNDRGYDGSQYPGKVWLCTESNLPRVGFDDENAANASVEMQRNFMLKVLARSQEWGHAQFHPYQLADRERRSEATFEYDLMGFYRFINDESIGVQDVQVTQTGIAYRTYGELLRGAQYSASLTAALNLPAGAEGVGYRLPSGKTAYLLWARTTQDGNEYPSVQYTPAGDLTAGNHRIAAFDYSVTGTSEAVSASIDLSGTPIFVIDADALGGSVDTVDPDRAQAELTLWPNPTSDVLVVKVPEAAEERTLTVLDATGRVQDLPATQLGAQGGVRELDVSGLVPGAYVLRAKGASGTVSQTFVKR